MVEGGSEEEKKEGEISHVGIMPDLHAQSTPPATTYNDAIICSDLRRVSCKRSID